MLVLDARSVEALEEHRDVMVAESMIRGEAGLREYAFVDEGGEPYHPARLTRTLHLLQRRAGLPEITLHDLRHTSATVALARGCAPKGSDGTARHASTQITLDRYSHVIESMQADAAEAIGRFLQQAL